jgi:hypothetical protein
MRFVVVLLAMMATTAQADTLRIERTGVVETHEGVIVRWQYLDGLGRIDFGSTGYYTTPAGKQPPVGGNVTVFVNGEALHGCGAPDVDYLAQRATSLTVGCP